MSKVCYSSFMKTEPTIISLDKTTADNAHIGGGKFAGLAKVKPLLEKYKKLYGLEIAIPKTYAISVEAFDKYDIAYNGVPAELVNEAMKCLVACGGNAAVRSSADIEDFGGLSHSGEFESVLFVKNKAQMTKALETVYASSQNVENAKMGIIIQPMIDTPQMAGVAYSQDFNGDPMVVINWTQGKPANFLLVNKENGNLTKVSKYAKTKGDLQLFGFNDLNTQDPQICLNAYSGDCMTMLPITCLRDWNLQYISQITALSNHLEQDLHYPVDLEFAISQDGKINVLQQRPYIMNNKYVIKRFQNGDWAGYSKDNPIIAGEVRIVDIKRGQDTAKAPANEEFKNKILLSKNSETSNGYSILAWADAKDNILQSKLKIDACHRIHSEVYGHYGNQFRERGTPFLSTNRNKEFQNVNDGDWLKIDLRTGKFKIYPPKDKRFNIGHIVQSIQQSKTRQ